MKRLAVVVLLAALTACSSTSLGPSDGGAAHAVRYEVTGSVSGVDVTFQNENGDTSQQGQMSVPWSYGFSATEGEFLYISAQNNDDAGSVTCTIYVDGAKSESNTSSGAYTICTASGSL